MRYTQSHEWISCEDNLGTVGITHYAQAELGDVVYVELPKIDQLVQIGEEVCVLESTKAAVDVYTPVSGKIVAVNENLRRDPSLINKQAEKDGWLFRIELINLSEYENLLTHSGYDSVRT